MIKIHELKNNWSKINFKYIYFKINVQMPQKEEKINTRIFAKRFPLI